MSLDYHQRKKKRKALSNSLDCEFLTECKVFISSTEDCNWKCKKMPRIINSMILDFDRMPNHCTSYDSGWCSFRNNFLAVWNHCILWHWWLGFKAACRLTGSINCEMVATECERKGMQLPKFRPPIIITTQPYNWHVAKIN